MLPNQSLRQIGKKNKRKNNIEDNYNFFSKPLKPEPLYEPSFLSHKTQYKKPSCSYNKQLCNITRNLLYTKELNTL